MILSFKLKVYNKSNHSKSLSSKTEDQIRIMFVSDLPKTEPFLKKFHWWGPLNWVLLTNPTGWVLSQMFHVNDNLDCTQEDGC